MAGGCSDGIIRLWDMRRKELSQSLRTHSGPVTSVVWSSGDAFLASGSTSGDIVLHSQTTGVEVARLRKDGQGIKSVQYSMLEEHVLASCNEAGSVAVWDTSRRVVDVHFPNAHNSPATGLAFSPVNKLLLCSSGLDQRLLFYDIKEKKLIKMLDSDAPLTCLAFNADGWTVAAGTLYGDIKVYDLRAAVQSKAVLRGHNGDAVNAVEFGKVKKSEGKKGSTQGRANEVAKASEDERSAPDLTRPRDRPESRSRSDLSEPVRGFRTVEEIKLDAKNRTKAKERLVPKPSDPPPASSPSPELIVTGITAIDAEKTLPSAAAEARTQMRKVTGESVGLERIPLGGDRTPGPGDRTPLGGERTPISGERTPFSGDRTPVIGERIPVGAGIAGQGEAGFSLKQMDMLRGLLESIMSTVRHDMKNENSNLHVEIIRQQCIQQVIAIQAELMSEIEDLKNRISSLQQEVKDLRTVVKHQQIDLL